MKMKFLVILMILCILSCTALADAPHTLLKLPNDQFAYEFELNGDVNLPQRSFDRSSNIYRPITYITMEDDGTVIKTETKTEHVATITYRLYYTINGDGEYVSGGVSTSNGYPSVAAVNAAKFAATVTESTSPVWSCSVYPDLSGISYSIKGGYITLRCNHTIYIDPDGNFVAGVPSSVRLVYSYSTNYP